MISIMIAKECVADAEKYADFIFTQGVIIGVGATVFVVLVGLTIKKYYDNKFMELQIANQAKEVKMCSPAIKPVKVKKRK